MALVAVIEPGPQEVVHASISIAEEQVDQSGLQELPDVELVARRTLQRRQKVCGIADLGRASEGRAAGSLVSRALLEQDEHAREVLPELTEPGSMNPN